MKIRFCPNCKKAMPGGMFFPARKCNSCGTKITNKNISQVVEWNIDYTLNTPTTSTPTITCPYCKSTNCKKLGTVSRGTSFAIFGFGSSKIGKQWHCNSCKSDF